MMFRTGPVGGKLLKVSIVSDLRVGETGAA